MTTTQIIPTFDYTTLDTEVRIVVQQKTGEIRDCVRVIEHNQIAIGERLIIIKDMLGHGRFLKWLEAEFEWSESTAKRYMVAAEISSDLFKSVTVTDLIAVRTLCLLASSTTPAEVQQEVVRRVEAGQRVTEKSVQLLIDLSKPAYSDQPATPDKSVTPAVVTNRTTDGHWITEAGEILRYIPEADRAWCTGCAEWRNFRETEQPDVWACKVCGDAVKDDTIDIYEPSTGEAIREQRRKQRPEAKASAQAATAQQDDMMGDLQKAQELIRKWYDRQRNGPIYRHLDMTLVFLGKAMVAASAPQDSMGGPVKLDKGASPFPRDMRH